MHGGRGEPVRLALHIANEEWEDERLAFPEFGQRKESFPFGAVPTLEMDGEVLTQTNAMLRYVGQQCELYPQDAMDAFRCDEILGVAEDLSQWFGATMGLKDDALKSARERLLEQRFIPALKTLNEKIGRTQGKFLCGDKMNVADLRLFVWGTALGKGFMDHIPTDLAQKHAPNLQQLVEAVGGDERIQAYYKKVG